MLLAASEGMLRRIIDEYESVCKSRKLKMNAGKSKVMVFERAREQRAIQSGVRGYTLMKDMAGEGEDGGGE